MDNYLIAVDKKICPGGYITLFYNSEKGLINLARDATSIAGRESAKKLITELKQVFSGPDYCRWDLMKSTRN